MVVLYHKNMKIMQRLQKYSVYLSVALCVLASSLVTLNLPNTAKAATCNGVETFFDWGCNDSDTGEQTLLGLLGTILNWVAIGVSVAVLGGIVYGAIMYASAGGNEAQTKKAVSIIKNAIIALILYFAMYSILQFLIPGGLFA